MTDTCTTPETTLTKWANFSRNYASKPTIDVEVLTPEHHLCDECDGAIENQAESKYGLPKWAHLDPESTCPSVGHYVRVRSRCYFCGTQEAGAVTLIQRSWNDSIECSRCGGDNGFPIGD